MNVFEKHESEVRGYCRNFPAVFQKSKGSFLFDEEGRRYLDFFAGAGALNYGHNNDAIKKALLDYIASDGVTHSLDMYTSAKARFLQKFQEVVLAPRKMTYKVQFPGPTGTNAVEAALKLARKITDRTRIVSFTNAFHGMTLGSLAVTGNKFKRAGAGLSLLGGIPVPFDGYLGEDVDTLGYLKMMLEDEGSGLHLPAAVIVETIQAEGGVNVARLDWLRRLRALTREHGVLLIVDEIQVGCGRTGPFFSFEEPGVGNAIDPDIICLSKSLSGYGLPLSIVLMKPEHDKWAPGEHNGTFRGHNPAFVTATAALEYWKDDALTRQVLAKGAFVKERLGALAKIAGAEGTVRGRGLIWGLAFADAALASKVSEECFKRGMIIETAGTNGDVLKLLPPLTITQEDLAAGLDIIEASVKAVIASKARAA